MKDIMTTLINTENHLYNEFLSLLDDLDKFMNSSFFTQFTIRGLTEEIEVWDNIVLSTDLMLKKLDNGESLTEDILYYNQFVTQFYNSVVSKYTLYNSQQILSQFMLKNVNARR